MTAFLALRRTPPPGLFQGLFSKFTKWRLVTKYLHAGIVIDGTLYESTFKHGVKSTQFVPHGWDLFEIRLTDKETMIERFSLVEGAKYDWFSLLAFVLPFRARMASWLYCYELCSFLLDGNKPSERITPEILLTRI